MTRKAPREKQSTPSWNADSLRFAQLVSILAGAINQQSAQQACSPVAVLEQVEFVKDILSADDQVMNRIEKSSLSPAELCVGSGFSRAKVNRVLTRLLETGRVRAIGSTRDRRYTARGAAT